MNRFLGLTALVAFSVSSASFATVGNVDTRFAEQGWAFSEAGLDSLSYYRSLEKLPDGKYIAAGVTYSSGNDGRMFAIRYLADGQVDTSYGENGKLISNFGLPFGERAFDATLQVDQKLLLAGVCSTEEGVEVACVSRVSATGQIDTTFGQNGLVWLSQFPQSSFYSITLDAQQRIVAVGGYRQNNVTYAFIVRLTSSGEMDTSFDSDGVWVPTHTAGLQYAVTTDAQNNIYSTGIGYEYRFVVVKLNANGIPDTSFDYDGMAVGPSTADQYGQAIVLDANSNILVGRRQLTGTAQFASAVTKLFPSGQIDYSFGVGGTQQLFSGDAADVRELAIAANGDIYAGGMMYSRDQGVRRLTVSKMTSTGAAITQNALSFTPTFVGNYLRGMVLESDGAVTLAGSGGEYISTNSRAALVQVNNALDINTQFGGYPNNVVTPKIGLVKHWSDAVVTPDGKILAVGAIDTAVAVLVRYHADGTPDTSFANQGKFYFGFSGYLSAFEVDNNIRVGLNTSGQILIASRYDDSSSSIQLIRLHADGRLDEQYGQSGVVTVPGIAGNERFGDMLIEPNDTVVVSSFKNNGATISVVRVLASGQADTAFGYSGQVGHVAEATVSSVKLLKAQDGGYLLASGDAQGIDVMKLKENGEHDTSFGLRDRYTRISLNEGGNIQGFSRNADNRLVVVGNTAQATPKSLMVVLDSAGKPDSRFGIDGVKRLDITEQGSRLAHAQPYSQGGFLLIGNTSNPANSAFVAHIDDAGHLVAEFGNGGVSSIGASTDTRQLNGFVALNSGSGIVFGQCQAQACLGKLVVEPGRLQLPTTALTFTEIEVSKQSSAQQITLTNTGLGELAVNSISITGSFTLQHNCPNTLLAAASCVVEVVFSPTVVGDHTGSVVIMSDDGESIVTLSGKAKAAPVTPPPTITPPAETGSSGGGGSFAGFFAVIALMLLTRRKTCRRQ